MLTWNNVEPTQKVQYVNFVFYDKEILDRLRETHISFAWIYHDKDFDLDDETGEHHLKKPHYHVLMDYRNTTTVRWWHKILDGLPANDYVELTVSPRGYYRYLIHADNPEKYQYDENERRQENGFSEFELLSKTDKNYLVRWITHFIFDNDITEYDDLIMKLDENGLFSELSIVFNHTIHFTTFLKSRRIKANMKYKKEQEEKRKKEVISSIMDEKKNLSKEKEDGTAAGGRNADDRKKPVDKH